MKLSSVIISREVVLSSKLKDDDDLQEAIKVLNDPAKYKEMLSAKVQKEEKK